MTRGSCPASTPRMTGRIHRYSGTRGSTLIAVHPSGASVARDESRKVRVAAKRPRWSVTHPLARSWHGERMRSGIVINAGDPLAQVELATRAEAAGWDGVFTYDAIDIGGSDMYDPWTLLAAMALATARVTLGAIVFAPTRRRPWKVAREAMTIDHLSRGRLVVPVGLGALDDHGFGGVG